MFILLDVELGLRHFRADLGLTVVAAVVSFLFRCSSLRTWLSLATRGLGRGRGRGRGLASRGLHHGGLLRIAGGHGSTLDVAETKILFGFVEQFSFYNLKNKSEINPKAGLSSTKSREEVCVIDSGVDSALDSTLESNHRFRSIHQKRRF